MKKLFTLFVIVMSLSVMLVACGGAAKPAVKKPAVAAPAQAAPVADKSPYEAVAKQVAASAGIAEGNYEWEAYEEAPETTWDDTFAYYNEQLTAAGWAGTGSVTDIENGKVGVFADTEGNKFVLIFVTTPEKAITLALFGK